MIQSFDVQAIPEATSPEESKLLFLRMRDDGLPGYVIRQAGADLDDALKTYAPGFEEAGFDLLTGADGATSLRFDMHAGGTLLRKLIPGFRQGYADTEFGLHLDGALIQGYDLAKAKAHYTSKGSVRASLFEPADLLPRASTTLPPETESLFRNGLVDTDILTPVCYRTVLGARDMLVFRVYGEKSLAHSFESQTPFRKSATVQLLNLAKYS